MKNKMINSSKTYKFNEFFDGCFEEPWMEMFQIRPLDLPFE